MVYPLQELSGGCYSGHLTALLPLDLVVETSQLARSPHDMYCRLDPDAAWRLTASRHGYTIGDKAMKAAMPHRQLEWEIPDTVISARYVSPRNP